MIASSGPANPKQRRAVFLFYWGPVLAFGLLLVLGSTPLADYNASLKLISAALQWLDPRPQPTNIYTLYQINVVSRKLTHVAGFVVLTLLVVRAMQRGAEDLRAGVMRAAFVLCLLFAVAGGVQRGLTPRRDGGPKDVLLDMTGILLVLGGTALLFAVKRWERKLRAMPPAPLP